MREDVDRSTGSMADKGLEWLERAWNEQWALRLVCLVLFMDVALMLRTGHGLSQWSSDDMALVQDVGWLAVVIVSFSVGVAIVIPVILIVLRQVGSLLKGVIASGLPSRKKTDEGLFRDRGYVPAWQLRDLALQERDAFLLRLYEQHVKTQEAAQASRERAGELTAAVLLTSLLDGMVSRWVPGSVGLVQAIQGALGGWGPFIAMAVLLCAGSIMKWAWSSSPDFVYYPPLSRLLQEKKQKVREEDVRP